MTSAPLRPPSAHFRAHAGAIDAAARLGPVVDLACGRGRHALAAALRGLPAVGVDRDAGALVWLRARAAALDAPLSALRTDLESNLELPFRAGSCGVILVFRFLYRPLAPAIVRALAPGGLLLYETFTERQAELDWGPRNPAFLLRPGELRALFSGLECLDYWEGRSDGSRPEWLARLAARRSR